MYTFNKYEKAIKFISNFLTRFTDINEACKTLINF